MLNKLLLTENCYSCLLNLFVYVSCYYSNANVLKFVNKLSMLDIKEGKEKNFFQSLNCSEMLCWAWPNIMMTFTGACSKALISKNTFFNSLDLKHETLDDSYWFISNLVKPAPMTKRYSSLISPPNITTHSLSLFDRKQRCLSQPRIILLPV